jgi:hypothetical protein
LGYDVKLGFESIVARYELGLSLPEELPDVAAQLISSGKESKSLVELAGMPTNDTRDARYLLDRTLQELGLPRITKAWAMRQFAHDVSNEIVSGSLSPLEGARLIWKTHIKSGVKTHDYDPFIYAASEMEDRPRDFTHFEKAIREEAMRWSKVNIPLGEPG